MMPMTAAPNSTAIGGQPGKSVFALCAQSLSLVFALCASPIGWAQGASSPERNVHVRASVTTQMFSDGQLDQSRIFIYTFSYGKGEFDFGHGDWCSVEAITMNNVACKPNTVLDGRTKGAWPKVETCDAQSCRGFTCSARKLGNGKVELAVHSPLPDGSGAQDHRVVADLWRTYEYSGSMAKHSDILGRAVRAEYRPIFSKDGHAYADFDMACSKLEIPVLAPR